MDILSKQKLTNLLIIILVVINIASLSFIWYRQLQSPPPLPPHPKSPGIQHVNNFFGKELNLTLDQEKQFDKIRKEHVVKTNAMKDKMGGLRREILEDSFSDNPDTDKINKLAEKIGETQKDYEEFLSEHFRNLSAACNAEQKEKLKKIFMTSLVPPPLPQPPVPRELKPGVKPPPPGRPPK
jgi:Spy/CpxP family protein refolding chaperone